MGFKKILRIDKGQSAIEFLCVSAVVIIALIAIGFFHEDYSLNNPMLRAFRRTVDHVMTKDFGAKVED
jgi:hypothetical protein